MGEVGTALGHTVRELPLLVRDVRGLVRELQRAAQPGGELMRLLDGLGELARARAEHERAQAAAERERHGGPARREASGPSRV